MRADGDVRVPEHTLLDAAAKSIARFVSSDNHNLKYLGITGLAAIVKDHRYAADHQMAVIECRKDKDDTLVRKTLDLLYQMINPVNVEFIVAKLLDHLAGTSDDFLRRDLVRRARRRRRFAPDNVSKEEEKGVRPPSLSTSCVHNAKLLWCFYFGSSRDFYLWLTSSLSFLS